MNKADRWYLFLTIVFFAPPGSMPHAGNHVVYGMFGDTEISEMRFMHEYGYDRADQMVTNWWKNPPKVVE